MQYLPQHGADFVYQIKKYCLTTQSFTVLHLMVQCSVRGDLTLMMTSLSHGLEEQINCCFNMYKCTLFAEKLWSVSFFNLVAVFYISFPK